MRTQRQLVYQTKPKLIRKKAMPISKNMFSQLTPALERSQGGLGIGLALVRALVELHGGKIVARSDGVGKSSEFIVRLPISAESTEIIPIVENIASQRILVVDAAESLALLLEMIGHTLHSA